MKNKISESIWSNGRVIVPLAEISFLVRIYEYDENGKKTERYSVDVVFKHSKTNEYGIYQPYLSFNKSEGESLITEWTHYRHEIEGGEEAFVGQDISSDLKVTDVWSENYLPDYGHHEYHRSVGTSDVVSITETPSGALIEFKDGNFEKIVNPKKYEYITTGVQNENI